MKKLLSIFLILPFLFFSTSCAEGKIQYKTVTFKSTEFVPQDSDRFNVQGELTLRGITKPVTFDAVLKPNASNSKLLDVYAIGYINRSDFGMKKSYGGVGEKVDIKLTGQWQLK